MNNDEITNDIFGKRNPKEPLTMFWVELEKALNEARADQERIDKIFWTQTVQNERSLGKIIERERADEREKRNTEARLEAIMTETDIRKNERAMIKAELEKLVVIHDNRIKQFEKELENRSKDKKTSEVREIREIKQDIQNWDNWQTGIMRAIAVISSLDAEK